MTYRNRRWAVKKGSTMTTNINTFNTDLNTARETLASLNLKGDRPKMVAELLAAETDDAREAVVEKFGAGHLRRGLRQLARRFEGKATPNQDLADVFWALRDDLDESDDTIFRVELDEAV